jgi:hypothetical protein
MLVNKTTLGLWRAPSLRAWKGYVLCVYISIGIGGGGGGFFLELAIKIFYITKM